MCISILVCPDCFHINNQWSTLVDTISRIVVFVLIVIWIFDLLAYLAKGRDKKQKIVKLLRNTITNNHDYASYEENNLLYTVYMHKLRVFSFYKICDYKDEMD